VAPSRRWQAFSQEASYELFPNLSSASQVPPVGIIADINCDCIVERTIAGAKRDQFSGAARGAAPQPSPSPAAEPSPPQGGATPAPAEQVALKPGGTDPPETRVVAPAERRQPRKPPTHVVTNQPRAPIPPTREQVVVQQNQKFDAARQTIFPPVGANTFSMTQQTIAVGEAVVVRRL
jgi:hypothetical protein